nr:hypothetical protein [uncultured Arsenicibacter sp.]
MLNVVKYLLITTFCCVSRLLFAQSTGRIELPVAPEDTMKTGQNLHPTEPKLIAETDQRFFVFKSNLFPGPERLVTRVYGVRAGVFFPFNVKVGAGAYLSWQRLSSFWDGYILQRRQLEYLTLFVEPYYFRRRYWELSTPLEVGIGRTRYELIKVADSQPEVKRSMAYPLGLGVTVALKSQAFHHFRPFRWLGFSAEAGYRLTLQPDIPKAPISYNGFYYSLGPTLLVSRMYADYKAWRARKQHPKKKK